MWRQIRNQCDLLPEEKKMGHPIPCGLDDSRLWDQADTAAEIHSKQVEDYTEFLMDECKSLEYATQLDVDWELYETPLLANLVKTIADWSGRTDGNNGSVEQMKKLHAIVFAQLRETVSEQEVKA